MADITKTLKIVAQLEADVSKFQQQIKSQLKEIEVPIRISEKSIREASSSIRRQASGPGGDKYDIGLLTKEKESAKKAFSEYAKIVGDFKRKTGSALGFDEKDVKRLQKMTEGHKKDLKGLFEVQQKTNKLYGEGVKNSGAQLKIDKERLQIAGKIVATQEEITKQEKTLQEITGEGGAPGQPGMGGRGAAIRKALGPAAIIGAIGAVAGIAEQFGAPRIARLGFAAREQQALGLAAMQQNIGEMYVRSQYEKQITGYGKMGMITGGIGQMAKTAGVGLGLGIGAAVLGGASIGVAATGPFALAGAAIGGIAGLAYYAFSGEKAQEEAAKRQLAIQGYLGMDASKIAAFEHYKGIQSQQLEAARSVGLSGAAFARHTRGMGMGMSMLTAERARYAAQAINTMGAGNPALTRQLGGLAVKGFRLGQMTSTAELLKQLGGGRGDVLGLAVETGFSQQLGFTTGMQAATYAQTIAQQRSQVSQFNMGPLAQESLINAMVMQTGGGNASIADLRAAQARVATMNQVMTKGTGLMTFASFRGIQNFAAEQGLSLTAAQQSQLQKRGLSISEVEFGQMIGESDKKERLRLFNSYKREQGRQMLAFSYSEDPELMARVRANYEKGTPLAGFDTNERSRAKAALAGQWGVTMEQVVPMMKGWWMEGKAVGGGTARAGAKGVAVAAQRALEATREAGTWKFMQSAEAKEEFAKAMKDGMNALFVGLGVSIKDSADPVTRQLYLLGEALAEFNARIAAEAVEKREARASYERRFLGRGVRPEHIPEPPEPNQSVEPNSSG